MSCEEAREWMAGRLAGGPAPPAEAAAHVSACAACQAELREREALWAELGALPTAPPSPDLAARFRERLVSPAPGRGPARSWSGIVRRLAAAVALFAAGLALGRATVARDAFPPPGPDTGRYVLLLHEAPDAAALGDEQVAARVAEYRAWARARRAEGRLEAGEKLVRGAAVVGGAAASPPTVSGFFVIRAASDEDALSLARDCPHARHGGAVEVRRIDSLPARDARKEAP